MSCKACQLFQDSGYTSYFRWKNANVEIRACEEHLTEIYDVLRKAQGENKPDIWEQERKEPS